MKRFIKADLCGTWNMRFIPNEQLDNRSVVSRADFDSLPCDIVKASVPGNYDLDLVREGKVPDHFVGKNVIDNYFLEANHVFYQKTFSYDCDITGNEYLCFEGIDTISDIYLNGELIAQTDNMLIPYELRLSNLKKGENDLLVHIHPTVIRARDYSIAPLSYALPYNYESLHIRKPGHMFGWDIAPRIVSAGIWRPCYIIQKSEDRIDDLFLQTTNIDLENKTAVITAVFNTTVSKDSLRDYKLRVSVTGESGTQSFEHALKHTSGKFGFGLHSVAFWWPSNLGKPYLYDVKTELVCGETVLDTKTLRYGIRTVELERTSTTDAEGNGAFCFYINGVKTFFKGTNWVPVDAFHSRDTERMPHIMPMLTDLHCNCIRCWGGNVYEDDLLYDFCDENGIMIWQDFAMACGIYPQSEEFRRKLAEEAEIIVKRLRNHSSIVLWAGDNECDLFFTFSAKSLDPNDNKLTRRVLPEVIFSIDPTRPYLPSSPYVDETAFRSNLDLIPENHIWGPRDYFKSNYYMTTPAHFASEVGYHGCPSPESIAKFLSKDKLWPWEDNDEWLAHATAPDVTKGAEFTYRIELMANQIKCLFGVSPDSLEDFSKMSQISQAEAVKFFIERFRGTKWRRTGIIWWNLIDCWPQFSDAIVDYYYDKKLAYRYIQRSQEDICLMFTEPEQGAITLMAVNDTLADATLSFRVTDITNNREVLQGEVTAAANNASIAGALPVTEGETAFFLIEWRLGDQVYRNHYLHGTPPYHYTDYLNWMKAAGLED